MLTVGIIPALSPAMRYQLRHDENIRRDDDSGAYYAEYFVQCWRTGGRWHKLGTFNTYDEALKRLVESRG